MVNAKEVSEIHKKFYTDEVDKSRKKIVAPKGRIAIIYNYHETPRTIINATHFIRHGITSDPAIDYFVVTNSNVVSIKFPRHVKIIYRDSSQYKAWGGWELCLSQIRVRRYRYFFLIKDTAFGPHQSGTKWIYQMISHLSSTCKLVGPTINGFQSKAVRPHVQAYCLCTDLIGISAMIDDCVFKKGNLIKGDTSEVMASHSILRRGYNIGCLIPKLVGIDFRKSGIDILAKYVYLKDPYGSGSRTVVNIREVNFVRRK